MRLLNLIISIEIFSYRDFPVKEAIFLSGPFHGEGTTNNRSSFDGNAGPLLAIHSSEIPRFEEHASLINENR